MESILKFDPRIASVFIFKTKVGLTLYISLIAIVLIYTYPGTGAKPS